MTDRNSDLLRDVPTNAGITLTVIDTSRKTRPAGLPKPYEYVLPLAVATEKYNELRSYAKSQERNSRKYQHCSVWKKGLTKGFLLNVFALGYTPGYCGDTTGVTQAEWEATSTTLQRMIHDMLGPDAKAYIEPYSKTNKFSVHFKAYIAYGELVGETHAKKSRKK